MLSEHPSWIVRMEETNMQPCKLCYGEVPRDPTAPPWAGKGAAENRYKVLSTETVTRDAEGESSNVYLQTVAFDCGAGRFRRPAVSSGGGVAVEFVRPLFSLNKPHTCPLASNVCRLPLILGLWEGSLQGCPPPWLCGRTTISSSLDSGTSAASTALTRQLPTH